MKGRGGARQPLGVTRPGAAKGARGAQQAKAATKGVPKGVKKGVAKSAKVAAKGAVKAALSGETGGRGRAGAVKDAAVALSHARKGTEDAATRQARAAEIYARLARAHPDAHCELDFTSPFELLVATILSAQCTDKRVNMTTPALFAEYPTPAALAAAPRERVEELVKSTGFFRNKAKSIQGMASALVDEHGGAVPDDMDVLVTLPGVGRKTANVILGNAFGRNEGVVVDTHVGRLANRLGLTDETDPVKVEQALMPLFPRERWTMLSHLLIFHGRRICDAKKPKCGECVVAELCPSRRE